MEGNDDFTLTMDPDTLEIDAPLTKTDGKQKLVQVSQLPTLADLSPELETIYNNWANRDHKHVVTPKRGKGFKEWIPEELVQPTSPISFDAPPDPYTSPPATFGASATSAIQTEGNNNRVPPHGSSATHGSGTFGSSATFGSGTETFGSGTETTPTYKRRIKR